MIKNLLLISITGLIVSCNSPAHVAVKTSSSEVNVDSSARFGGRGGMVAKTGDVTVAVYDNNDDSFREFNKTVRFGLGLNTLNSIANTASDAIKAVNASNNATTLGTAAEATNQLKLTTEAAKAAQ